MNNIPLVFWLIPIASVVALGMAWFFFRSMMREEEGTERMKEIAAHVRKGAMAYLKQQYKVVTIVFVVLAIVFAFMAYVLKVQNPWVPFAFLTGGLFSGLSGFFGMKTATYASARTANGARSGLFMEQIRIIQEMRDADRKSGRTGIHIRPRFGIWENVVGALSSGRDAETGQKKPGADFQKVLEAFLQVEEPYLHAVRPEAGRWEYAGGILGVRSSVAWVIWDAQHFGVPQRRRRVFLVADFAGYSAIPILAIPDSVPGYSAPRRVPRQIAATLIGSSFAYAGRA